MFAPKWVRLAPGQDIYIISVPGQPSLLDPYTKGAQIFVCPSETPKLNNAGNPVAKASYGLNQFLATSNVPAPLTIIPSPAETVMFGDDQFVDRVLYMPGSRIDRKSVVGGQ